MDTINFYWINLDRSYERRILMEDQLKKYNIVNNKRIEAIDGDNINLVDYKNICENITKNALACTLSHIKAIEYSYNNNDEYSIIMEDDCNFEYVKYQKYSLYELIEIMNKCYKNWSILQLCITASKYTNNIIRNNPKIIEKNYKYSTTAYLISRNGMKNILNSKKKFSVADIYIYNSDVVNTYYLTKPYFTYYFSNKIITTIHNHNSSYSHLTEDSSKQFWDNYYFSNSENMTINS